jgi:DNA invertase Pin-like site-specific DNA recombinase
MSENFPQERQTGDRHRSDTHERAVAGLPAVIYAAKSTEDRHGSIPTQLDDCRELARREGWTVVGEFSDEAFSAYHGNRGPGLAEAKQKAIEKTPCILVAQDADRFARGAGDRPGAADHLGELYFALRRQGVKLWSVRSGELDLLRSALEGERATGESARKSQAVRAGLERRKKAGKPTGPVPFGYMVEKTIGQAGEVSSRRVEDPDEVPVVIDSYERIARGERTGEISRSLNAKGLRTMRGKPWNVDAVRWMIENRSYQGENGYPRIVGDELAEKARAALARTDPAARQRRKGGRPTNPAFILRGIAHCVCGAPMYCLNRNGRTYVCRNVQQRNGLCRQPPIRAAFAEQHVLAHLDWFLGDLEKWAREQIESHSGDRQAIERQLQEQDGNLSVLVALREQRMAELEQVGITKVGMEVIDRIDRKLARQEEKVLRLTAQLAEWTASPSLDAIFDFYDGLRDLILGRVKQARGARELNAALADVLAGVWLRIDGGLLQAEFELRKRPEADDVLLGMLPVGVRVVKWARQIPQGSHTSTRWSRCRSGCCC